MPLYEYECDGCQKIHEVLQKFSDTPLAECPECQGPVKKLMSLTSFSLKGSGWYTTDYKRSSASAPKPSESKPAESACATPAKCAPQGGCAST